MGKTLVKNSDILSGICRLKLKDNEEWSNVCKESIFLNSAGSFWLLIMSRHCVCVCVCVPSHFNCVLLFVTLWTVAHQAPLSMGFSRQEYWSYHFLLRGILLAQGSSLCLLCLLCWQVDSLPLSHLGNPVSWETLSQSHPVSCFLILDLQQLWWNK